MTINTVASAIIGSMQKWDRKPADFYPTPSDVTYSLLPYIEPVLPVGSRVWEPACGDGAMSTVLESAGYDVVSTDLREDSGYGRGGVDFLAENSPTGAIDAVITNPPFNVAHAFIEHAMHHAPVVAMLLKSQYWHAARRLALFEKHPPTQVLALTWRPSFLEKERGSSPLMDVMWVVWVRDHSGPTTYQPIRRRKIPAGFLPVRATDDFDDLIEDDFDSFLGAA